ncbi:MAG: flagellar hook-associated protein FlgK [Pseudomonadota bacterium]
MGLSSSFNIAQRALHIAQAAMEVSAHNVSNVNTAGYSRQVINLATTDPFPSRIGPIGSGVDAVNIQRVYDPYLTRTLVDKSAELSKSESQKTVMDALESVFNESDGNRINEALSDFWSSWESVANNPEGNPERVDLLEKAQTLASTINVMRLDMDDIKTDINSRISEAITEVNALVQEIAEVNEKIIAQESGVHQANDLRDAREQRILQLSELIDINYFEDPANGAINIMTPKGTPLVADNTYWQMTSETDVAGDIRLLWQRGNGGTVDITDDVSSGAIGGLLEFRDETMSEFYDQFDAFTETLIKEVNRQHSQGVGLTQAADVIGTYDISTFAAHKTDLVGDDNDLRFTALAEGLDPEKIGIKYEKATSANSKLEVHTSYDSVNDVYNVTVTLPVNANGVITATAKEVAEAINADKSTGLATPAPFPPSSPLHAGDLIKAEIIKGETGKGLVTEMINPDDPNGTGFYRLNHNLENMLPFGEELSETGGSFDLIVYNQSGEAQAYTISVNGDDTQEDILAQIGDKFTTGAVGLSAEIVEDTGKHYFRITAEAGYTFAFANDDSNALMALGLNTFFEGYNNLTIKVNDAIEQNTSLIASGKVGENGEILTGDNSNALEMADLKDVKYQIRGKTATISDAYNTLGTEVGAESHAITRTHDFNASLVDQITSQRDMVSAVSLDEEMADLMKYQYMYQAAAKLISVTDEMLQTLLALKS